MDWLFPFKVLMGIYFWLILSIGDAIFDRSHMAILPIDMSAPTAILSLRSGSTLPPGAYIQTKQNFDSICNSTATIGADAIALLRSGKWEIWFPYAEVGIYIDGTAHSCNINIAGSIIMMSGNTGVQVNTKGHN